MNSEQIKGNGGIFCGIDITKLRLLGEGRQGRVYLLPDNRVIKVYKNRGSLKNQLLILQHSAGSRFFPKLYEYDDDSIVMEFIKGTSMNKYLKSNGINKKISLELVELMNEFIRLGFTRIDIRISHIFLQEDESLRIIDPRGSFKISQSYPNLMLRGLKEFGAIDSFFHFLREDCVDKYNDWKAKWEIYKHKKG